MRDAIDRPGCAGRADAAAPLMITFSGTFGPSRIVRLNSWTSMLPTAVVGAISSYAMFDSMAWTGAEGRAASNPPPEPSAPTRSCASDEK